VSFIPNEVFGVVRWNCIEKLLFQEICTYYVGCVELSRQNPTDAKENLTMSEIPQFGEGINAETKTQSKGTRSSGPSIKEVSEGTVQMVIDAIQQKGGVNGTVELSAFSSDAIEIPEKYAEHYDFGDAEKLSVEDLFDSDWEDYDVIGAPPVTASKNLSEEEKEQLSDDQLHKANGDEKKYVIRPEYAEAFKGLKVLKGGTTPISKAVNGRYSDLVVEAFGEDFKVTVGKGKQSMHDGDAAEAQKYISFRVSDSETAALKRHKARNEVGNLSDEDFEEWKEANGFTGDE